MANLSTRDFNFQGNAIRCVGTKHGMWFVAKDVCAALGLVWCSTSLDSIPKEWIGVRAFLTPIRGRDGVERTMRNKVTVINLSAVYRLILRSNKPTAVAFANWVAGEVLPEIGRTGSYSGRRRERYENEGKQLEWIEQREEGIQTRKKFTDSLKGHGVVDEGFAICTDEVNMSVLGGPARAVKASMGLTKKDSLRDNLSRIQLVTMELVELASLNRIEKDELSGNAQCAQACRVTGQLVADAVQNTETAPLDAPIPMPRPKRLRSRTARIDAKAA